MLLEASIQIVKQRQNKQFLSFLNEDVNDKIGNYGVMPQYEQRSTTKKHHYNRLRGLYMQRSPPKRELQAINKDFMHGEAYRKMQTFLSSPKTRLSSSPKQLKHIVRGRKNLDRLAGKTALELKQRKGNAMSPSPMQRSMKVQ